MTLTTLNLIAFACGSLATALSLAASWRLRDTTFAAPCLWAALSLVMLSADAAWCVYHADKGDKLTAAHLEYLAAITVVAPFVALLGAKRPQHIAWQWIVASLIALLAFQDLRSWSIAGAKPSPHTAWQWLLAALLMMQLCNYLPTRYATAALLASAGQCCVLAGSFSFFPNVPQWSFSVGVVMICFAVVWAAFLTRRWRPSAGAWQDAWLEFRDLFGVLWALRVCQRVNGVIADQTPWRLSWTGISPGSPLAESSPVHEPLVDDAEPLQRTLRSVLARFVSPAWFTRRGLSS